MELSTITRSFDATFLLSTVTITVVIDLIVVFVVYRRYHYSIFTVSAIYFFFFFFTCFGGTASHELKLSQSLCFLESGMVGIVVTIGDWAPTLLSYFVLSMFSGLLCAFRLPRTNGLVGLC